MDIADIVRLRPILDYDVKEDKIAYVVSSHKPIVEVADPKRGNYTLDLEGFVKEVAWVDRDMLALVVDANGKENHGILTVKEGGEPQPVLVDGNDNFSPYFLSPDRFLFLSNRDRRTIHLYLYDNGEVHRISSGDSPVFSYCTDGVRVAYSQGIYDQDLTVFNIKGNRVEGVLSFRDSEELPAGEQCFSKRGVLFTSNRDNLFNIGIWDGGEVEWLVASDHDKPEAVEFQGQLYYVEDEDGTFKVKVQHRTVFEGGLIEGLKVESGRLYFLARTYNRPTDLYYLEGEEVRRVTDSLNGVDTSEFVRPSKLRYRSFDGLEVPALLYSRGEEKHGAVLVHGGPDWEWTESFNAVIQFLLKQGFKVICPNVRGSTGYGKKFNHLNDRDLGGGDLRDVVEAARYLGLGKVAIEGESYGGYLTMMALTKYPDLWCGGVAVVPFVNWFTEKNFEREFLQQYDEIKIGSDEQLLRDRSPIFFLDRITAPLLLLAGENDPRCPAEETMQVVEKLREMGKEFQYKVYNGEGHGFMRRENLMDYVRRVVEFISKECKGN